MSRLAALLLVLLFVSNTVGCNNTGNQTEVVEISPPAAGYNAEVEIVDVYCLNPNSSSFPFRFTLKNLGNDSTEVDYRWTLNDPMADQPGFQEGNINDPHARQYQGRGIALLPPSGVVEIEVTVKKNREYDSRFYVMYIGIYRDDILVGYYRGQKSTYDWDYSITPPIPIINK